jgi:transcriptional regulator with XRE-family HTH domain
LVPNKTISLGELIYSYRRGKQMSQAELAQSCGMSEKHLSRIENDHVKPDYSRTCAIADNLGIKPSILFQKMGEMADQEMAKRARLKEDSNY